MRLQISENRDWRLETLKVLQEWTNALDSVEGEAIAALVPQAKGWEPLCGFYRRRCLPSLIEYINRDQHL